MSYLANHPKLGLCIVTGTKYLTLEEALNKSPVETSKLLDEGDIKSDAVFVGNDCYRCERDYKFWVDVRAKYPNKQTMDDLETLCSEYGLAIAKQSFGNYEMLSYTVEAIADLEKVLKKKHPEWSVTYPKRPELKEADLVVEEVQNAVVDEYPEDTAQLKMSDLVPLECRGESWAFSETESIYLDVVSDDGYCIENNWESRGDYWIFDTLPRGKRLIHSDILGYNKEFSIDLCS